MPLIPGSRVGHYEIAAFMAWGCGAPSGEVYRARDTRGGKPDENFYIKVLHLDLTAPDKLARFERESKALQALSHPNICTILDFGTQDGFAYEVWEFLEGETLRERLNAGAIPQKQAVDYMLQVANGLSAGHQRGVIHGELKPDNLFVTNDGHVRILDFGRWWLEAIREKERSAATGSDYTGTGMRTAGYMSPEEVRGQPSDARSDIFAFGAILYEMLAGKRAFPGADVVERIWATLKEDPPDLSLATRGVSPGLNRLVRRCLEKDPERRFQSVRNLASDLAALSQAPVLLSTGVVIGSRARPWRIVRIVLGVILILLSFYGLMPLPQSAIPVGVGRAINSTVGLWILVALFIGGFLLIRTAPRPCRGLPKSSSSR